MLSLIDTDSFQFACQGRVYRGTFAKDGYVPAELLNVDLHTIDRTQEHDAFALAVCIFQLLMDGNHPFSAKWLGLGPKPPLTTRILNGDWPVRPSATEKLSSAGLRTAVSSSPSTDPRPAVEGISGRSSRRDTTSRSRQMASGAGRCRKRTGVRRQGHSIIPETSLARPCSRKRPVNRSRRGLERACQGPVSPYATPLASRFGDAMPPKR